jgi:molecular chaperone DnaJ
LKSDPYKTLGVDRNASQADLKRVYRRLAMRWHPDRNDHPGATERFKEIRAAYDALLEPDDDVPADEPVTEPEPEVREATRAADIRLNLEITLTEAISGCRKTIHYQRGAACPTCDGTGEHGLTRTRFCKPCHGSGRVRDTKQGLTNCLDCGGRGFFSERICPDCAGSGREIDDLSLQITVPPGMLPGDDLRLAGQGEPGDEMLQSGDLFLTIVIHSHGVFELRGRDLLLEMPVNALALIAGSNIEIPLPVGALNIQLEPGEAVVRELHLAKKGYPGRGKTGPGDLRVKLCPVFPAHLNAKQRKLLQQAVEALNVNADDCLPSVAAWWRQVRAGAVDES